MRIIPGDILDDLAARRRSPAADADRPLGAFRNARGVFWGGKA